MQPEMDKNFNNTSKPDMFSPQPLYTKAAYYIHMNWCHKRRICFVFFVCLFFHFFPVASIRSNVLHSAHRDIRDFCLERFCHIFIHFACPFACPLSYICMLNWKKNPYWVTLGKTNLHEQLWSVLEDLYIHIHLLLYYMRSCSGACCVHSAHVLSLVYALLESIALVVSHSHWVMVTLLYFKDNDSPLLMSDWSLIDPFSLSPFSIPVLCASASLIPNTCFSEQKRAY